MLPSTPKLKLDEVEGVLEELSRSRVVGDLEERTVRHASSQFGENPLGVFRVMQLVARFGFEVAPETIELCRSLNDQYRDIDRECVLEEFVKMRVEGHDVKRGLDSRSTGSGILWKQEPHP